jgi:hypothetical protein
LKAFFRKKQQKKLSAQLHQQLIFYKKRAVRTSKNIVQKNNNYRVAGREEKLDSDFFRKRLYSSFYWLIDRQMRHEHFRK